MYCVRKLDLFSTKLSITKKLLTSLEINNKGMKNRGVINNAGTYLFSFYLRDLQTIFRAQFSNFLLYYLKKNCHQNYPLVVLKRQNNVRIFWHEKQNVFSLYNHLIGWLSSKLYQSIKKLVSFDKKVLSDKKNCLKSFILKSLIMYLTCWCKLLSYFTAYFQVY